NPGTHNWAASVLGIWRYHAMQLGWCDIGYHYLIDPNGVIYEGRYTGVRDDGNVIDGAHALGHNRSTIGIAFMGNFQSVEPTTAAIQALDNLLGWIGSSKNISFNTEQFYAYKNKTLNTIVGHRDIGSTICPGNMLYAKLPEIRQRAAQNSIRPNDALWIKAVSANQTTIEAGDVVTVRMTIQNLYSTIPISSSAFTFGNADAGFTYDQSQCWANKDPSGTTRFPRPDNVPGLANQRFRVIAGVQGWDSSWANTPSGCPVASTIDHPWRWSIGSTPLAPGATRVITGRIRLAVPGSYTMTFGLLKDWVGYPDAPCNRALKQGACQLNPITIRVIKPSPTYAPDVRTQVVVNTATHARLQTQVSLNQTRIAADRINATREVQRGLPSRTPTATRIFPTATAIPVMQSVIALRTATHLVSQLRTATSRAALTNTMVAMTNTVAAGQMTQTAMQLTQVVDNITATAEPETRTPTTTPTTTATPTRTHTVSRTATQIFTQQPSRTPTKTATPARLLDPTSLSSVPSRLPVGQLDANATHVWVLSRVNPPMLIAYDPTTLAQMHSTPIEGVNATLMRVNQHNPNEIVVVGRYAWDLLAVQRFTVASGTPVRTGVWLYQTMANPVALVSTDRYVYLAVNHAAHQNTPATAEIIVLHNRNVFTEATGRRWIQGAISDLRNLDSADLTVVAAGRNLDNSGFIIPVAVNRPLDLKSRIQLPRPPQTVSTFMMTHGLIPAMLIVSSDSTSWARIGYNISTQKLVGLQQQPLTARSPLLWRGQPFISLSTSADRLQLFVYGLSNNSYHLRYTEHVGRLGSAEIQYYAAFANRLYWHDGQRLYRAVMTIP
ncbi:MAG: N-acetylmuramoyl-L-alanine amidase, partial [Chloroflexi bacterium]|nr:N-acetylmuramoyl-L-alanine amidase [Chloroflexota bacterium]